MSEAFKTEPTIRFDIFIAGDIAHARNVCREYCLSVGLCVTVEAVDFIYTGGEQAGVKVGLINYPRFPSDEKTLHQHAAELAEVLMFRLYQRSYSIVGPQLTEWISHRPNDECEGMCGV